MSGVLCVVYVSTASQALVTRLSQLCGSSLVHSFRDATYNRTSFYLLRDSAPVGGLLTRAVEEVALELCSEAAARLDLREHAGTHPAVGVVDHICFSPLGAQEPSSVASLASAFAAALNADTSIPVYTYGAASASSATLSSVRKSLGYFAKTFRVERVSLAPDVGALPAPPRLGVACVGAVPMVVNFNLRYRAGDPRSKVALVSQGLREEGLVQSLTLDHEAGTLEVACNLLNVKMRGTEQVLAAARRVGEPLGCLIESHYTTGPTEETLLDTYLRH